MSNKQPPMTAEGEHKSRYWNALKNRVHKFADVLYQDSFTVRDMEADEDTGQGIIMTLARAGCIDWDERKQYEPGEKAIKVWEWQKMRTELVEYYENRDELPCGDRPHIPAHTDENGKYICKYCGAKHSRGVIENAL